MSDNVLLPATAWTILGNLRGIVYSAMDPSKLEDSGRDPVNDGPCGIARATNRPKMAAIWKTFPMSDGRVRLERIETGTNKMLYNWTAPPGDALILVALILKACRAAPPTTNPPLGKQYVLTEPSMIAHGTTPGSQEESFQLHYGEAVLFAEIGPDSVQSTKDSLIFASAGKRAS